MQTLDSPKTPTPAGSAPGGGCFLSGGRLRLAVLLAALASVAYAAWLLGPTLVETNELPGFAKMGLMGTPVTFLPAQNADDEIVARTWIFLGILLLSQWLFLQPLRRGPMQFNKAGRALWPAAMAAALMVALLGVGFFATLMEIPDWWVKMLSGPDEAASRRAQWEILLAMAALWLVWSVVFYAYWSKGDAFARAGQAVRWLIAGSTLELLIAIPTHAWVYRRTDDSGECYCARGTYTGLVFGFAVLLWAFGPGLLLLFLREKERREPILRRLCPRCGASMTDAELAAGQCPHCGNAGAPGKIANPI